MVPARHVPERSCMGCGKVKPQRELVRLVLCDGVINVDAGGKRAGRGAYLCSQSECWEAGLGNKRLERALRANITPENRQQLLKYGKKLRS